MGYPPDPVNYHMPAIYPSTYPPQSIVPTTNIGANLSATAIPIMPESVIISVNAYSPDHSEKTGEYIPTPTNLTPLPSSGYVPGNQGCLTSQTGTGQVGGYGYPTGQYAPNVGYRPSPAGSYPGMHPGYPIFHHQGSCGYNQPVSRYQPAPQIGGYQLCVYSNQSLQYAPATSNNYGSRSGNIQYHQIAAALDTATTFHLPTTHQL